jgi:hypothetical protein
MMKRLSALILVLGTAAAANAVVIEVDGQAGKAIVLPDTVATVAVIGEDSANWLGYIRIEEGGSGELSNPVVLDAAGHLGSVPPYLDPPWFPGYELTAAMSPGGVPSVAAGPQFHFDYSYSGDLAESTTISLYVDPQYEVPESSVQIVPEPMVFVLLGLGGLCLRRRK